LTYQPVRDYHEFVRRVKEYHDEFSPCDSMTYCYVYRKIHLEKKWPTETKEGVHLILVAYLKHWGRMQRWLGRVNENELLAEVQGTIEKNLKEITRLESANIRSDLMSEMGSVQELFNQFCGIKLRVKSKNGSQDWTLGPTSTGKLLHMLLPQLCIIWDREVVREKWKLGDTSGDYATYLQKKREELEVILKGRTVRDIEVEHKEYLESLGFTGAYEPITKMLDEVNY